MNKSFKDFLSSGSAMPKPVFERDFFDLAEEADLPALPLSTSTVPPGDGMTEDADTPTLGVSAASEQTSANSDLETREKVVPVVKSKPSKKSKAGTPGNTLQPVIPLLSVATTLAVKAARSRNVRQTFVLSEYCLEQIRDYVHARRSQGDYTYSQKQLLEEAVNFLMASRTPAPPRPSELREREQQLRVRIQEGRRASTEPVVPLRKE